MVVGDVDHDGLQLFPVDAGAAVVHEGAPHVGLRVPSQVVDSGSGVGVDMSDGLRGDGRTHADGRGGGLVSFFFIVVRVVRVVSVVVQVRGEMRTGEFGAGPGCFQVHAAQDVELGGKLAESLRRGDAPRIWPGVGEQAGFAEEVVHVAGFVEQVGEEVGDLV